MRKFTVAFLTLHYPIRVPVPLSVSMINFENDELFRSGNISLCYKKKLEEIHDKLTNGH